MATTTKPTRDAMLLDAADLLGVAVVRQWHESAGAEPVLRDAESRASYRLGLAMVVDAAREFSAPVSHQWTGAGYHCLRCGAFRHTQHGDEPCGQ